MLTERQFTTTLLPDGTSIDDLVSIDERWVAARVMTDPDLYGDGLDKRALGLKRARTTNYQGLIFATWNPQAPDLADHFSTMDFYYRIVFGLTDGGFEVAGPPLRWVENTNWKFAAENL